MLGRTDILSVFLRDDTELRAEIIEGVVRPILGGAADAVSVDVARGVVTLCGTVPRRGQASRIAELAGRLEGVVAVHDQLVPEERIEPIAGALY